MATYYVTIHALYVGDKLKSRTLVIEADFFTQSTLGGSYSFYNYKHNSGTPEKTLVASVPFLGVFAVAEKEAFKADWVEEIDEPEDAEDTPPEAELPTEKYPVEHWKNGDEGWWGVRTQRGFVPFRSEEIAKEYCQTVLDGPEEGLWSYLDLTGFTKVED